MSRWPKFFFIFYLALTLCITLCLATYSAQSVRLQVVVDVWTNKGGQGVGNLDGGTYRIGEYIEICFDVNADVERLRFHVITPDNRDVSAYDGPIQKGRYCVTGYEIGPIGVQRVIVEAWVGGLLIWIDEVDYNVVGCPSHGLYIGLEIYIKPEATSSTEDLVVTVTGWVKPTGIDWSTFKSQCYAAYPGSDYYHINYIRDKLIRPTLGVDSLTEVARGIDDSKQIVWTKFRTKFSNLKYSDYELKVLRLEDSIKRAGGFIDEVKVESSLGIWKAVPQPTYITSTSVYWRNSRDTAPDRYEIYLYPLINLRIMAEGIPPDKTVNVFIDGRNVGSLSKASPVLEKRVKGLQHEIDLDPRIISLGDGSVRYSCQNCPMKIDVDQSLEHLDVILSFKKEFKITLDTEPRVCGVIVDGKYLSHNNLPYEIWWPEGSRHQISLESVEIIGREADFERDVYRFAGWGDGQKSEVRSIEANSPFMLKALFNQIKQYKVTISSDYGEVYGICDGEKGTSLWCDYGSTLSLNASSPIVYLSDDRRALFSGWVENGKPILKEVIVDSAKDIRAIWTIQYFVKVDGVYSEASGGGWYDEGTEISITIDKKIVNASDNTRYVFDGWEGDCAGVDCNSEKFVIKISKPLSFRAIWRTEYHIKLYVEPALNLQLNSNCDEWIREGGECTFNAPAEYAISHDTMYKFVRWKITSDGVTQYRTDPLITLRIDKPILLSAEYEPWYRIYIDGGYATPSIVKEECEEYLGDLWCKDRAKLVLRMPITSTGFPITQEFKGWRFESDGFTNIYDNREFALFVSSPARITAIWVPNYTGLQILILGIVVPSTYILYALLKKRRLIFISKRDREMEKTLEKLKMLEEVFKEGKISREAYLRLKEEYEEELKKKENKSQKFDMM